MASDSPQPTQPSAPADISRILANLNTEAQSFSDGNESSRNELLAQARSLCLALETPVEAIARMVWSQASTFPVGAVELLHADKKSVCYSLLLMRLYAWP